MDKFKYWLQRLAEEADLPGEPLPGIPIVELAGDRRVLIEHHKGVTQYGTQRISVRVSFGEVCVCGNRLELVKMTADQLVISGTIRSIGLSGRDEDGN